MTKHKSHEDKHRLVVDAYSSKVVQTIYAMREQGTAYGKIAAYLNNEGILSPFAYWHSLHGKGEYKYTKLWMYASVKEVLSKEVYTGTLVQNYTGTLSYKSKKMIYKPESEWIRHENSHEALVSREQWEKVQESMQPLKSVQRATESHSRACLAVNSFVPTAKLLLAQTQAQNTMKAALKNMSAIIVSDIRVQVAPFAHGITLRKLCCLKL